MHVTQHGIDKALEDGGSIGKPERKYQILIVSHGCVQRCLPFIPLTDTLVPKMVVVVKVNPSQIGRLHLQNRRQRERRWGRTKTRHITGQTPSQHRIYSPVHMRIE